MPIYLYVAYGCFHTTVAELSSCGRGHMAAKLLNYLDLYRKKMFVDLWISSTISSVQLLSRI